MSHELYLLDSAGTAQNSINGVLVAGQLPAWKGLSFSPSGGTIDKAAQNKVSVPLTEWRNAAVGVNTQLMVYDTDLAAEVTRGPVVDEAITVDADGVSWAALTFADELYELAEVDTTSAFATSANEALTLTGQRLLSLANHPWLFLNDVTGLDGIAFTVFAQSVAQAFGKLAGERFAHFRRESSFNSDGSINARVLHLSAYGTPYLVGGQPLWFGAPGANPTVQVANNAQQRIMLAPQVTYKRSVKNALTVTGAGTGISELTLRPLYGVGAFAGFDPAHPVLQRPTQDGGANSFDGYDYYIQDTASIAANGAVWGRVQKSDVGPVVSPSGAVSRVDETAAAVALYTIGLASLRLSKDPVTELRFSSPGVGDIRNIGGMTVHVQYNDWAYDDKGAPTHIVNIDADYVVTEVVRTVKDDGTAEDAYTLSTNGQYVTNTNGVLIGGLDAVAALHAATGTYPMSKPIPKSQNIGPGADMVLTIPADNSMVRRHWALVNLQLEGMVHTRSDFGHVQDVVTTSMPHDVNALPHDVNALPHDVGAVPHDVNPLQLHFSIGNSATYTDGSVFYDPQARLSVTNSPAPVGAVPLVTDGKYVYAPGKGGLLSVVTAYSLGISSTTRTTDPNGNPTAGTGGKLQPTDPNGTPAGTTRATSSGKGTIGGTLRKTTGGAGGTVGTKTHAAGTVASPSGFGATLAVATQESVYRGPAPTGVTVLVDGVQRFGPYNASPGALDITQWVSDQNRHTVTIKSPTNGAADVLIDVRDDVATVAVKSTG